MSNLEFINEQIEECKQSIQQSKIRIDEDKKYPSLVKCHKERIEELKLILKRLEQIKTILEAWEVVKDKIEIKRTEIFDHVLRIKRSALTHEEFRPLKNLIRIGDK